MTASNRNLLAAALATLLFTPAAWAEKLGVSGTAQAVQGTAQGAQERALRDTRKAATDAVDQVQRDLPPPSPPQSQGAEHAAEHSSVVQRDLWTRLDTDGDGRISSSEGAADTAFQSDFTTFDADRDGFVTDTEYRSGARSAGDEVRTMGDAEAAAEHSTAGVRDVMARLDANADGSVSADEGEADAGFNANFAAIDRDGNGVVTTVEYRAWAKAERK